MGISSNYRNSDIYAASPAETARLYNPRRGVAGVRRGEAVDLLGHRDRARLPAAKSDDGKWGIDPAELRRVYP